MRLLDRYILRELLLILVYCLSGFMIFWVFFNLLSDIDNFQEAGMGFKDIVMYYFITTPRFMVVVLPVALLLSLLYTSSNLARNNEIIAMRAAGLSIWRISTPYLVLGFILSLLLLAMNEWWIPDSDYLTEELHQQHDPARDEASDRYTFHDLNLINQRDQRIWNIGWYHTQEERMKDVLIQWTHEKGKTRRLIAKEAVWTNLNWHFSGVRLWLFDKATQSYSRQMTNEMVIPEFRETPDELRSEIKISQLSRMDASKRPQLSLREILIYKQLHPEMKPAQETLLDTQFHGRLAEPWTCLVVVLISLPFGAASGRRNLVTGVASSIFIAFSYFILLRFGLALGTSGTLWPWLGAWLPNILFAGAGIWWTSQVR